MRPELSSCVWIPEDEFDATLRDRYTVEQYKLDGTTAIVEAFRTDREGWIGLPRVAGLKLVANRRLDDRRSLGVRVRYPKKPKLRDYQTPFVAAMIDACETRGDFIAYAATGKGKTVCGLAVAAHYGVACAVLVDQEDLVKQWRERCREHLGLRDDQIGLIQGDTCDYQGKAVTLVMLQTITRRSYPEAMLATFGTVIFDEVHVAGAPVMSRALMLFPAAVRFGLSATPKRRDALQALLDWNLGPIRAELADQPLPASVYVLEHDTIYTWASNNSKLTGRFINEVAADGARNLMIARAVQWLYDSGRDVLVIGERIEQLCALQALVAALGVPADDLGLIAKQRAVYAWEKDPTPPRRPPHWEKGTPYTPVRFGYRQKTIPKAEREARERTCRILFATYAIFAKGRDIPRLSAGIDATPRSTATQVYGRVLRVLPGKLRPIWATIADTNSFRSLYQLDQRLTEYEDSNAEVFLWNLEKGRKPLDLDAYHRELRAEIKHLRSTRTGIGYDAPSTPPTPTPPTGNGRPRATTTAKPTRSLRPAPRPR